METPSVSVVVPVFNGMPYLPMALEAVRNQTYPGIDLIVVDGGSTDGSTTWLTEQGIPFHRGATQGSAAHTWTEATNLARGDLVLLLCQDDLLYPGAITHHAQMLTKSPECCASVARRDIIDARGTRVLSNRGLPGMRAAVYDGQELLFASFRRGTNIFGEPHCVMFRREPLQRAMPWRGERPYVLDLATYEQVLGNPNVLVQVSTESLGAFRVSTSSWSTRLVSAQLREMREWQTEYASRHGLVGRSLREAHGRARIQAWARTSLYRFLRMRNRLAPA